MQTGPIPNIAPKGHDVEVLIPFLYNKRPLKEGEELMVLRAPKKKQKKAPQPVDACKLLHKWESDAAMGSAL